MDTCFFNGNAIDIKMKCSNNAHECSYNLHFNVSILNKLLTYRRDVVKSLRIQLSGDFNFIYIPHNANTC